jgi:type IV pilus assembly protein PilE
VVHREKGFTLIEVLVVLGIVAVLAAIAYPSYTNQVRKGRRADAQGFLMDMANREQQYLLDARGYALGGGAIAALSMAVPDTVSSFYTVTVDTGEATPSFVITATPKGSQVPDGNLTLDQNGTKTLNGASGW